VWTGLNRYFGPSLVAGARRNAHSHSLVDSTPIGNDGRCHTSVYTAHLLSTLSAFVVVVLVVLVVVGAVQILCNAKIVFLDHPHTRGFGV